MKNINMDQVACPHCGTSGKEHLEASAQIQLTDKVDGEEWISCPNCSSLVEFTEDGVILRAEVSEEIEWRVQIDSALHK